MSSPNELRLFVSSTFRDMQEEREYLVKKIFPEIRSLCRERGVTFTEVDLRWGLTDEDVVLGQVVRACLEEIDKCRPYFIGLVGDRYGWAPPLHEYYKDPELFVRWPWLEDAAMEGASITDVEFRHGALNDPAEAAGARFFYKESAGMAADGAEDTAELDDLKERVRSAGLSVADYSDPEALGAMVREELIAILDRDFADARPPSQLEIEQAKHAAFAASRRRAYIPNPLYLKKLNAWLGNEASDPLVLYAESGSGKSSLMAFWCEQLRRRQPELHIIEHYVGIGAGDTDHLGIIKHVLEEIKQRYNRSETIPSKPADLEREFANWLGFGIGAPMLIIIDGVNQLTGHALTLHWIPEEVPEGVRLVVSSTVEGTLVDLRKRGWSELGMQPLSEAEREAVIVRFLAEYGKSLAGDQVRRIASDAKCAHPLFLRTLLEEIRLHGLHEQLDRLIDDLLATTGTEDLFQNVLARFEADFAEGTIRDTLSLIWASRAGLAEEDLATLTGLSRLKLSTIMIGLDFHLVRRDGRLTFFHDYLLRAVLKRYLTEESDRRACYHRLVEHFRVSGNDSRSTLELLGALEQLDASTEIEEVLSDLDRFPALMPNEMDEVSRLWAGVPLETVVERYDHALAKMGQVEPQVAERTFRAISTLYKALNTWGPSEKTLQALLDLLREHGPATEALSIQRELAAIKVNLGKLDEVEGMVDDYERRARDIGAVALLNTAMSIRGDLHRARGEYKEAISCLLVYEEHVRNHGKLMDVAGAIGRRGGCYTMIGDFEQAFLCFDEQEKIGTTLGSRHILEYVYGQRGYLHFRTENFEEARRSIEQQLVISRSLGRHHMIAVGIGILGMLHSIVGEHREALDYVLQKEAIARRIDARELLLDTLLVRGNLEAVLEEHDAAFRSWKEAEFIATEIGDPKWRSESVRRQAALSLQLGDLPYALRRFREAADIIREVGQLPKVAEVTRLVVTTLLAILRSETGDVPEQLAAEFSALDSEEWRDALFAEAERHVAEIEKIGADLSDPEQQFYGHVYRAGLNLARGGGGEGAASLKSMIDEAERPAHRAILHFYLAVYGKERADHREKALRLYDELLTAENHPLFRWRIAQLVAIEG